MKLAAYLSLLLPPALLFAQDLPGAPPARDVLREGFDLEDGAPLPPGWRVASGEWGIEGEQLVTDSMDGVAVITLDGGWRDCEVRVRATLLEAREPTRWLGLLVRAAPGGEAPWSQFTVRQRTRDANGMEFAVRTAAKRWSVRRTARASADTPLGVTQELRVRVVGTRVQCFLEGVLVLESALCVERPDGCIGLAVSGCRARFDDLEVRELRGPRAPEPTGVDLALCRGIAHRGFSSRAPENTLVAVRAGIEAGAELVEFDVHLSQDRVPVLLHDTTVDRTTDGRGAVAELTLAELGRLDAGSWKGREFAGERIPTLEHVLEQMAGSGAQAAIEVKPLGMAEEVVQVVRRCDAIPRSFVISFEDEVLRRVHALEPRLRLALVVGEVAAGDAGQQARALAARAEACGASVLDLNYRLLSPELVGKLRARGFAVWSWTIDEAPVMDALARWGVDGITTNRPDLFQTWRERVVEPPAEDGD
jgi:glycerophosphoryl diester phosphodiesterase